MGALGSMCMVIFMSLYLVVRLFARFFCIDALKKAIFVHIGTKLRHCLSPRHCHGPYMRDTGGMGC